MKPYGKSRVQTKGLAGRRRSTDTPHRRRSLRVDKKAARQEGKQEVQRWTEGWSRMDGELVRTHFNVTNWH